MENSRKTTDTPERDVLTEDVKAMGIENWHEVVKNRGKWRDIVMMAKTTKRVAWPGKKNI